MSERSWQFRTTRGLVTVREDAIAVRSTPGRFLAGQRRRWRASTWPERGWIAFQAAGLCWSLAGLSLHAFEALQAGETSAGLASTPHLVAFALFAYALWSNHVGETTIPLSNVERVALDEDEGTLTIEHRTDGNLRSIFRDEEAELRLSLSTADARREAREIFRLRGIDLDDPRESAGTPEYRVITESGVCFCARCRSQISPSDDTCRSCGYALRILRSDDSGADRIEEESVSRA